MVRCWWHRHEALPGFFKEAFRYGLGDGEAGIRKKDVILIGGRLNQIPEGSNTSLPQDVGTQLAAEGARYGVTANAIAPGYIGTEMLSTIPENVMEKIVAQIPVGRLGQPDEIARGVEFLTSDNAGFITGSTLSINGGQHMY